MLRVFIWTFAAIVIACGISLAAFRIDHVRENAYQSLQSYLKERQNISFEVENVTGFLPFHWNIKGLKIEKEGKPLVEVKSLEFAISPLESMFGSATFSFVTIEGVTIPPSEGGSTAPIIVLPLKINDLLYTTDQYRIEGTFESRLSDQSLWFEGLLSKRSTPDKKLELHASCSLKDEQALFALHLQENHHGFVLENLPFSLGFWGSYDLLNKEGVGELFGLVTYAKDGNTTPFNTTGILTLSEGIFTCEELKLYSDKEKIDGHLSINFRDEKVKGKLKVQEIDLSRADDDLHGLGKISIQLLGAIQAPAFRLRASSESATYKEESLSKLRLRYSGKDAFNPFKGRLSIHGSINSMPLEVSSKIALEKDQFISFSSLHARLASSTLQGHLQLAPNNYLPHGHLEGVIKNLSEIDSSIAGALNFSCQLTRAKGDERQLSLLVEGADIKYEGLEVKKLTYKQKINDTWGIPNGEGSLHLEESQINEIEFNEIFIATTASANLQSWPFTISAKGKSFEDGSYTASGQWHRTKEEMFIHLSELYGELYEYPLQLKRPINIFWNNEELRLSKLELSLGEADITYETALQPDHIFLKFDVEHLPVDIVNLLLEDKLSMRGTISSVCRVKGPIGKVQGALTLDVNDVEIFDEVFAKLPILSGNFEAILNGETLRFSGGVHDPSTEPIAIRGTLPLALSLYPWELKLDTERKIDVHLKAAGDVTPFLEFFVTDTTNIGGNIDVNVHVGGAWDNPKMSGHAHLSGGSYESLNTGILINNIDAKFVGNGSRLVLESLKGVDGKGGTVTASGNVAINPDDNYPFSLKVNLEEMTILRLDYAEMQAVGKLLFSGNTLKGIIEGDVALTNADVDLPSTTPVQMRSLDVTYINLPEKQRQEHKKKPWPIDLDVTLNIPRNFTVEGSNLESEWRGKLALTGTTQKPLVNGSLQIVRGEYSFNGREFVSTQGSINFAGDPAAKTTLYILGEQQIERYKIGIVVKGPISKPELGFRSNPPLSEKEILSWILFNRSVDEITPFQVAKLSQAVFSFGGNSKGSEDFLSKLRNSIGIDRIDINSEEIEDHNEISLRVGKYISNGVLVSLSKSITAEANQVAIEAKLLRDFKVQAEVGDNAEGKMTIKWEKDY